jgi:hypothetical protein
MCKASIFIQLVFRLVAKQNNINSLFLVLINSLEPFFKFVPKYFKKSDIMYQLLIARVILTVSMILTLATLSGGGLPLPPFKSLPYLKTNDALIGVYGGCLKARIDEQFFTINEDWKNILLVDCASLFKSPPDEVKITNGIVRKTGSSIVGRCKEFHG